MRGNTPPLSQGDTYVHDLHDKHISYKILQILKGEELI